MDHLKPLQSAARPFGLAAALVLAFMMLFTTYAVLSRQLFDAPVLGVVDVMELALVACIFIGLPGVFLRDEHVTVDVIDSLIPRRWRVRLRLIALVITLVCLILMMTEMIQPAMEKLDTGEATMTLGINRFWHWVPIIFGFAMSTLGTAWVLYLYIRHGAPKDPTLDAD